MIGSPQDPRPTTSGGTTNEVADALTWKHFADMLQSTSLPLTAFTSPEQRLWSLFYLLGKAATLNLAGHLGKANEDTSCSTTPSAGT
jgi:hypothetical protein